MSVFLTLTSREPQCPEHEDVLDKEDGSSLPELLGGSGDRSEM